MSTLDQHLERLAAADRWTYRASRESAAEPAAWTAIALAAHGLAEAAMRAAQWLANLQQADGAVGVSAAEAEPRWPTSLAMLAWTAVDRAGDGGRFTRNVQSAARWALNNRGKPAPRSPQIGHDTQLVGWSWAADTHAWLEPSCFFVMGLRAAGFGHHPRVREGVRLIVDRLLPAGGANYGNTIVLGQPLLPHVQPTGVAMLALCGENVHDRRVGTSLDFLERSLRAGTAPASLAFACLGLMARGRRPEESGEWIAAALNDAARPLAEYEQALLLLAGLENVGWQADEAPAMSVAAGS
jgi:hypothetical protein